MKALQRPLPKLDLNHFENQWNYQKIAVHRQYPANLTEPNQICTQGRENPKVCVHQGIQIGLLWLRIAVCWRRCFLCAALELNIASRLSCRFSSAIYGAVHVYLIRLCACLWFKPIYYIFLRAGLKPQNNPLTVSQMMQVVRFVANTDL